MSVYRDVWTSRIPSNKLMAYKQMIDEKRITLHSITYEKSIGRTTFEYESEMPHDVVKKELARRSS